MSRESMQAALAAINAQEKLDSVLKVIPMAIRAHSALETTLKSHDVKVKEARRVTNLIHEQNELQTCGVIAGLRRLESLGTDLKNDLVGIGEDRGGRVLERDVQSLVNERRGLVTQIRLASVGLVKIDGGFAIDVDIVNSTHVAMKRALKDGSQLLVSSFLVELDRKPDAKGRVRLTDRDYERLTRKQIQAAHPEIDSVSSEVKTRILCNCLARGQSIQILGPVGEDLWRDIAFIKIEGLVAADDAIQFGYAVTPEVFMESLDRQERRIRDARIAV